MVTEYSVFTIRGPHLKRHLIYHHMNGLDRRMNGLTNVYYSVTVI